MRLSKQEAMTESPVAHTPVKNPPNIEMGSQAPGELLTREHVNLFARRMFGSIYGNDGSGTYAGASGGRRRAPQQPQ